MPERADNHERPLVLEVERFEHVPAGAERVLLRIDGRYSNRPGTRVLDAMLFVDDGLAVHRHAPLGHDGDEVDSWLWRAAFDVPSAYLTDERTRFALESEPGCLIDLPRPTDLVTTSAVPLTSRAAHLARRYAGAIAVLLTVAVAPGGLPAMARTEVLRVHNPDGSVVYMSSDGHTLAEIPADAVIVDQNAPAAPAPAAPTPAPAQTDTQTQTQPPPIKPDTPNKAGWSQKQTSAADGVAVGGSTQASGSGAQTGTQPPTPKPQQQAPQTAAARQAAATPAPAPKKKKPRKHHSRPTHQPVAVTHVHGAPPAASEQLQALPALLASPGSKDAQLQSMNRVGGNDTQAPASDTALPTKDLQNLGDLVGGPAHGHTTAPPVTTTIPTSATAPPLIPLGSGDEPQTTGGQPQQRTHDPRLAPKPPKETPKKHSSGGAKAPAPAPAPAPSHASPVPTTPSVPNPSFFNSLPGPASAVPDFVISKFRVPPFLLPIYQAAGIQYGIRWEVLAAINEIETDYGRNLNVSSAGALGWMQFMPATWQMYGVDANKDHQKDPYNPVDAIFAAARYLKAAGGDKDVRQAIFAYNHAGWYVDSVMLRAKLIAGYPADLISSLTGLTEGHFPVAAHARYANGAQPASAANLRRGVDIFTQAGAPVVAVNDGEIKKIGWSKKKGHFIVLQDVYGNQYTYSQLASVAQLYPVPKQDAAKASAAGVKAVGANDPAPTSAASAGGRKVATTAPAPSSGRTTRPVKTQKAAAVPAPAPIAAVKRRLFAHPQRPVAQKHGGFNQVLDMHAGKGFETYDNYFSQPLGLNSRNSRLRPLKVGSRVLASTVLGQVADGRPGQAKAPRVYFEIRPAGQGAPKIDPTPILDGWKLLESTAIYRAKGKNALYGDGNYSIGEAMLLPKALLAKRVLSDPRITIYAGGRQDIKTGQVDRRVLVVLEYLAEAGLNPTVSCLKSGHSLHTSSGNISEHTSGNAVDIAAINGVPIAGHQGPGDVTEQAVRRLMMLQGTMEPHQIISLLNFGRNTMAMADHSDHIHVGFHPLFGQNRRLGREAMSVLQPGQWDNLVQRIGQIDNPTVPTKPSRWSIPDHPSKP